jgi:predicted transcriptional regulator
MDTLSDADLRSETVSDTLKRTQISLTTLNEDVASFDKIANLLQRDRNWVMLRAFRFYLEGEGRDLLRYADGLTSLDRGEGQDFDAAMDELEGVVAKARPREAS